MDSGIIIGVLALFTIGIVLAISIFHFGYFLKDPRNKGAAKNVFVHDGESATTKAGSNQWEPDKPLSQRLDEATEFKKRTDIA